ncbi:DUF2716 domain-containing protein [Streptomyces sp. NPDC059479]|uniref:DUF2716 domain-containing protein n=1 Tax=Streptomyces sp. NPDC059479 TaxID=3346848 RepID=UPI00367DF237
MPNESVVQLSQAEYRRVWDRFYAEFSFRPSVNPTQWPGIKEPAVSVTWSLASPHLVGGPGQEKWPLSPYPDGDYYVFLSEDFLIGSFGHPWESSLCLFGQELLDVAAEPVDEILGKPIRRSGLTTHHL